MRIRAKYRDGYTWQDKTAAESLYLEPHRKYPWLAILNNELRDAQECFYCGAMVKGEYQNNLEDYDLHRMFQLPGFHDYCACPVCNCITLINRNFSMAITSDAKYDLCISDIRKLLSRFDDDGTRKYYACVKKLYGVRQAGNSTGMPKRDRMCGFYSDILLENSDTADGVLSLLSSLISEDICSNSVFDGYRGKSWDALGKTLLPLNLSYVESRISLEQAVYTLKDAKISVSDVFKSAIFAVAHDHRAYRLIPENIRNFQLLKDILFLANYKVAGFWDPGRYDHYRYLSQAYFYKSFDSKAELIEKWLDKAQEYKESRRG